jgi:hypothetical protein
MSIYVDAQDVLKQLLTRVSGIDKAILSLICCSLFFF